MSVDKFGFSIPITHLSTQAMMLIYEAVNLVLEGKLMNTRDEGVSGLPKETNCLKF